MSPTADDFTNFEEDRNIMIKNIELKSLNSNFQRQLAEDIKAILKNKVNKDASKIAKPLSIDERLKNTKIKNIFYGKRL